jgi:hypothetical protein
MFVKLNFNYVLVSIHQYKRVSQFFIEIIYKISWKLHKATNVSQCIKTITTIKSKNLLYKKISQKEITRMYGDYFFFHKDMKEYDIKKCEIINCMRKCHINLFEKLYMYDCWNYVSILMLIIKSNRHNIMIIV